MVETSWSDQDQMRTLTHRQQGVTLIEMLIVLAMMAVLAAIVVPSLSGFANRGKSTAYSADRQMLQVAVDGWRTDVALRETRPYPILLGSTSCLDQVSLTDGSLPDEACNPYLDIAALADVDYLEGSASVRSAETSFNTTATNSPSGHYGWFLNANGSVDSYPLFVEGVYP